MPKTGTREWATTTVNCVQGCSHGCIYCYARHNAVNRFQQVAPGEWSNMRVRKDRVRKSRKKEKGVVMFPSAHDITPEVLEDCLTVLVKLLAAGNEVLVVSKPHLECIIEICKLTDFQNQITFRFSIGGMTDLAVWEPSAPTYNERVTALAFAFNAGWKTSISAEPLLEPWNVMQLYENLEPFLTGEFWIGKLNNPSSRVKISTEAQRARFKTLIAWQTDEAVMRIVHQMGSKRGIRWKDSYKEVIARQIGPNMGSRYVRA